MKKLVSLLLCLTLLFSFTSFSFAEEMAMLAVDEVMQANEEGPVDLCEPDEDPIWDDMLELEAIEASAEAMSIRHEEMATANAAENHPIAGYLNACFNDFSGTNVRPEGLESFANLNSSYTVTVDSSYEAYVPDGFTRSSSSTSQNYIYSNATTGMAVSIGISSLVSLSVNYNWLLSNGYTAEYHTYNGISVVSGVTYKNGNYYWALFFNTSSHTVMMQTGYSSTYSSGASVTNQFFTSIHRVVTTPLSVSNPTYSLSADKKSIFINRPAVSGGTGNYTFAYNIYDSKSNPVNYFYSSAAAVAATPGYNGTFNVFVVVSDGQTSQTVNTGWVNITGNTPLTVKAGTWSISADKRSVFIYRPTISGGTGNYTIAYNIYDSNGNPVNYFYSYEAAVAATPGYNGLFNVYIVVSDGTASQTVMTGWFELSGYPVAPKYRALCIGQTYASSPDITTLSCCATDARSMAAMLKTMTSTPYTVTTKTDLTASQITSAISTAFAGATSNDISLFYYSGHGVKYTSSTTNNGALVGTDDKYVLFSALRTALDKIPGKKIVILDSCYSGNAINKSIGGSDEITDADLQAFASQFIGTFKESFTKSGELAASNYYVLAACRKDQTSTGGSTVSVFTRYHELCCGYNPLTSSRINFTCDANGDGKITLNEAYTGTGKGVSNAGYSQVTVVYPSNSSLVIYGR